MTNRKTGTKQADKNKNLRVELAHVKRGIVELKRIEKVVFNILCDIEDLANDGETAIPMSGNALHAAETLDHSLYLVHSDLIEDHDLLLKALAKGGR